MYYKAPLLCFDSKAVKAWRQLRGSSPGRPCKDPSSDAQHLCKRQAVLVDNLQPHCWETHASISHKCLARRCRPRGELQVQWETLSQQLT